jgi:anti-anti-sigma factor
MKTADASTEPAPRVREESAGGVSVLHLSGRLRWPVSPELRQRVAALLARDERTILVDLANVTAIDAAGVGELVRVHALAVARDGELWIDNAARQPRRLLALAGLLGRLSVDPLFEHEQCS